MFGKMPGTHWWCQSGPAPPTSRRSSQLVWGSLLERAPESVLSLVLTVLGLPYRTRAFSSHSKWRLSLGVVPSLLIAAASLAARRGPRCEDFCSCWGLLQLWISAVVGDFPSGPVAVGSSCPRDQTHVPCIGKPILNHWTARDGTVSALYSREHVITLSTRHKAS